VPSDDYFIPTDLDALRMESELLTLENTYLKQQVDRLERELQACKERELKARQAAESTRKTKTP
jgi:hypothetical protein